MSMTRQQIAEELRSLGAPVPGENKEPRQPLTKSQIAEEVKKLGGTIPNDNLMHSLSTALNNIPGLGKFAKSVEPITTPIKENAENTYVPLLAHGLQGAGNIPISIGNLIPGMKVPHLDYAKHTHPGRDSNLSENIAEFIGGGFGASGAYKQAGNLLPKASSMVKNSKWLDYFSNALRGFGTGYASGESKGEEGDAFGFGRLSSGAIGAAIPTAVNGVIDTSKLGKAKFGGYKAAEPLAEEIAHKDYNKLIDESGKLFTKPFSIAEKAGVKKANIKKTNIEKFLQNASDEEREVVAKAFKTKKLDDIHEAYKDVGRYLNDLKNNAKKGKLEPHEKNARKAAIELRTNLEDALIGAFDKAGGKEAVNAFKEANKHWVKVAKNKYNPLLNAYREGELLAEDLIPALYRNKKTKAAFAKHFPDRMKDITQHVEVPQNLKTFGKYAGLGTLITGGGGLTHLGIHSFLNKK